MLILHASADNGELLVWGETPAEPAAPPPKRRAGKPRGGAGARSPRFPPLTREPNR
jgi:hypothetical protein